MTTYKTAFQQRINDFFEKAKDKNHNLTIEEFANSIGATKGAFRGWLAGTGEPSLEKLKEVASKLNTTPHYLIGVSEDPTPLHTDRDSPKVIADLREGKVLYKDLSESQKKLLDRTNELPKELQEHLLGLADTLFKLGKEEKK